MDMELVGAQIAFLRKERGLTQAALGEALGVSFQAVSKWERGESLPDTALLIPLAQVLQTTVEHILIGGHLPRAYRAHVTVAQMREGLLALKQMGILLGRENCIYRHAINGINHAMNTDIEQAFCNDTILEVFVAEALMASIRAGNCVSLADVEQNIGSPKLRQAVVQMCKLYGME